MGAVDNSDNGKRAVPYVSFATFDTFVSDLKANGTPGRIDRSILKRFAGGTASQLVTSLKAMGLIDDSSHPTEELKRLADAYGTERWPEVIGALLRHTFGPILDLDLTSATPSQFAERFASSFAGGAEVHRKATAFFFNAAKVADIPIGARILSNKRPNAAPRKQRTGRKKPEEASVTADKGGDTKPEVSPQKAAALHHQLVDILSADMTDEQKQAVWTLVLYLKEKEVK